MEGGDYRQAQGDKFPQGSRRHFDKIGNCLAADGWNARAFQCCGSSRHTWRQRKDGVLGPLCVILGGSLSRQSG